MEKVPVFLMFYPIGWERHTFDFMSTDEITDFVKKHSAEEVKFVPWGDNLPDADYDADLFNDYDDMAEDYLIADCKKLCKEKNLTKDFIMNHWCYPVKEDTMDKITKN